MLLQNLNIRILYNGLKCELGKYDVRDQKMLLCLAIPQTRQVYTLQLGWTDSSLLFFNFQIVTYSVGDANTGYVADVRYEGTVKPYHPAPAYAPAPVYAPAPAYGRVPIHG